MRYWSISAYENANPYEPPHYYPEENNEKEESYEDRED